MSNDFTFKPEPVLSLEEIESISKALTDIQVSNINTDDDDDDDDDDDFDTSEYDGLTSEQILPLPRYADTSSVSSLTESEESIGVRKNILTVKVPRFMKENVKTGFAAFDRLMAGDGVTPSTACLVTGVPGSGKSSLMIQVSDAITNTNNIAVYNSKEESAVQLSRTANRMRLKHGFEFTNYENIFDIIEHVRKIQDELYQEYINKFETIKSNGGSIKKLVKLKPRQVFLTIDSLQTLEMPHWEYDINGNVLRDHNGEPINKLGKAPQGDNMHLNITRYLSSTWCKQTYGILFLIGQVTKDGQFAGKQGIKHWIDAHLHLEIDKDRKSPTYGERVMEMTKNRFGLAGCYTAYEIEARGLKFKGSK